MQIHSAASRGDIEGIAWCLKRNTSVNQPDTHGTTPLISAAAALGNGQQVRHATLETLRYLLEQGANPNAPGFNENTAALAAAGCADVSALALLHSHGAELGHVSTSRYTALTGVAYQPASSRKYETMRYLLEHKVSPNIITVFGESPLSVAALLGDFQAIRLLLNSGADPAPLRWTPLFHALAFGSVADVEAQITPSIDHNTRDSWEQTAFHFAVKLGESDKLVLLHNSGFNASTKGRCGRTALQTAAIQNHTAVVSWLVGNGAELEETDDFQNTPLMMAAEANSLEAVEILLLLGAKPDAKNHVGSMAVNLAASTSVIAKLVQTNSLHINAIDGSGDWPLKAAAARNDPKAIQELHGLGAIVDLTSTGETALHEAVRNDALEATSKLLELGANPNAQDVDGAPPLTSARSREVLQLLLAYGADQQLKDPCGMTAHDFIDDPLVLELLSATGGR